MKKGIIAFVVLMLVAGIVFATPTSEMADTRARVNSVYGKDASGNLLSIRTNASGEIITDSNLAATYVRKTGWYPLTTGDLDYTTDFSEKTLIKQVLFSASEAITETVTITVDDKTHTTHDTVVFAEDLVAGQYISWAPVELVLEDGDELKVECTDNNSTGTVAVNIIGETIN